MWPLPTLQFYARDRADLGIASTGESKAAHFLRHIRMHLQSRGREDRVIGDIEVFPCGHDRPPRWSLIQSRNSVERGSSTNVIPPHDPSKQQTRLLHESKHRQDTSVGVIVICGDDPELRQGCHRHRQEFYCIRNNT